MRRKFNKLLLMSLVPLTIATAIPTVALSACAKSSKHGDQPKPSPTPTPYEDPSGLPKDYTTEQYENVINKYITSVTKMTNEQIVDEVDKVTNELEQVNQNCFKMYDNDFEWLLPKPKIEESDFRKFYDIISEHTSINFIATCDWYIQYGKDVIKRTKQTDITPYGKALQTLAWVFGVVRSEFFVQQLFILEEQYITKNTTDFDNWPDQQKHQILNLMLELGAWCWHYYEYDLEKPTLDVVNELIINDVFLKKTIIELKNYMSNFIFKGCITWNNCTIDNPMIPKSWEYFYRHMLKPDIYVFCVPFEKFDKNLIDIKCSK